MQIQKKDGFKGQRSVEIPRILIKELQEDLMSGALYLTEIGFYPNAKYHGRSRMEGCDEYIFFYCVEGRGWITLEDETIEVQANQFFVIPKNTPCKYGSDNEQPWTIYWVHYSGKMAPQLFEYEKQIKRLPAQKISFTEARIELFEEMMQNLEMGYSKENLQYTCFCLAHFLATFRFTGPYNRANLIEEIVLYMKDHLHNKLTLESLSKRANLSTSHFSAQFKARTGRSPMDYLIHLRIQRACQYLHHGDMRVSDIAHKVGYEDLFYFSRIFKKIMGVSPINYRKRLAGELVNAES